MTQIIGISGRKSSGKTTVTNFIYGHEMLRNNIIEKFEILETGDLAVNALFFNENGDPYQEMGVLKIDHFSEEFCQYASVAIWPFVKSYDFASALKEICISLFGLSYNQCFGTNDEKNTLTKILWENMPGVTDKSGLMTAREFMEYFGTSIMRKIYQNVWIDNCLNRVRSDNSPLAIITDCRFPDEVDAIHSAGGKVIRLTRDLFNSQAESETALDEYSNFDAIIDNKNMSIAECSNSLLDILTEWNITKRIPKTTGSVMYLK